MPELTAEQRKQLCAERDFLCISGMLQGSQQMHHEAEIFCGGGEQCQDPRLNSLNIQ